MDSQPTETAEIHIVGLVDDAAPNKKKDGRKKGKESKEVVWRFFFSGGWWFLKEVWVLNTLALLLRILTSLLAHVMRISVMCGSSLVY